MGNRKKFNRFWRWLQDKKGKKKMQDCNQKCTKSDLVLNVKHSRTPRFKAGSELQGKVNLVNVEVFENATENIESTELRLRFQMDSCFSDREI